MKGWKTNMDRQRLLIDTNVVLDFLLAREPFDTSAKQIMELIITGEVDVFISINSFTDIIYFVQKKYDITAVREQMSQLLDFISIIEAGHKDAVKCLKMCEFDDIEDAFQVNCAEKADIDYIITRNIKDFKNSEIPAVLPEIFLEKYI